LIVSQQGTPAEQEIPSELTEVRTVQAKVSDVLGRAKTRALLCAPFSMIIH